jgi:hypothetical protein
MVDSLEKGEDVTKKVASAFKKAQTENRKLGLDQVRFQSQLLDVEKQLAKKYSAKLKTQKDSLTAQIQDNLLQQQLNDSTLDYLRTLSTAAEEEKKVTDEKKKQSTLLGFAESKYKEILKSVKEFISFGSVFKMMIDAANRFSKISTDLGKNLGYSADKADDITDNMARVANYSSNANMTLANFGEAAGQLADSLGLVANYSEDALATQVMLTKQFGLTGEEASGIYKLSLLTGKSSKDVNDAMVGAFVATRNQLKAGIPFKATIAEAAKVSGQLAANLQNNPASIVKAVTQAKALGTSLEQVKNQGEALLNFESSIENELKAELLVGKELNLERARAAALAGDQISLAEELNKNVGTLEDFQKMNVLQQKALAEAVGLTADQLADQLRKQKLAQESGKSLAQITKEEALEAEQRQNIQDKFNQSILKLQDFIGNLVAGPLSQFIDALLLTFKIINFILTPLQWMADLSKYIGETISGWADALGPFGILLKGIAGIAILLAGYGAYAALAWIPIVGPVLGAVAAAAVIGKGFSALASQKADDMVSEGGYGKRTLLAPEGAIKLNDNDTVIAGTDLGGGGMSGGSIDLTPMIAAINEVKIAVNQLMNRPVIITMDSKQVGSSLVQASPKSA